MSVLFGADLIQTLLSTGRKQPSSQFNFTFKYIDEVMSINNLNFKDHLHEIYPHELEIKEATESYDRFASSLDILLSFDANDHYDFNDKIDCFKPQDCSRIKHMFPYSKSGVYQIYPASIGIGVHVYCDMAESCGGWTVIQRRMNETGIFKRNWGDYKRGFGKPDRNYWLGNDIIHQITANKNHELLIVMEDFDQTVRYAHYGTFFIGNENEKYKLNVTGYSGTAGDSLAFHNGLPFSTYDQDNDSDSRNCAVIYKGAWWYKNCYLSNLNGAYVGGFSKTDTSGMVWMTWRGAQYSLKSTVMMVR